jgi:hypothetical protein
MHTIPDHLVRTRRTRGRKTEIEGEKMQRREVSLDSKTLRLLAVLGKGNISRGVREAARVAYEQYQRRF